MRLSLVSRMGVAGGFEDQDDFGRHSHVPLQASGSPPFLLQCIHERREYSGIIQVGLVHLLIEGMMGLPIVDGVKSVEIIGDKIACQFFPKMIIFPVTSVFEVVSVEKGDAHAIFAGSSIRRRDIVKMTYRLYGDAGNASDNCI